MKFLLVFSILLASASLQAQKLSDDSIVKDSTGTVYPAAIWKALLMKGSYTLKPENPKDRNTAFLLVQLTEEEQAKRFAKMHPPQPSASFRDGQKINMGRVKDINGNPIDLKDNKGRITVINFWFINCPPCRMEIPDLNNLVKKYGQSDSLRFVGIALDEAYALKDFLSAMPFDYRIIDNGRYIAQQYQVQSYPTHVIIDQEGKVYFHTAGLASNTAYWLDKSIRELLSRQTQTTAAQ